METTTHVGAIGASRQSESSYGRGVLRLALGSASIYAFGLAIGAAKFSFAKFGYAAGLVSTPVLFAVFFAPSLWVMLTLFDQTIGAADVAEAAVEGVSAMGSLLLGLVPVAVFFELTAGGHDGSSVAMVLEMLAFGFAGAIGLFRFGRRLSASPNDSNWVGLAFATFAVLAVVFGATYAPEAIVSLHDGVL